MAEEKFIKSVVTVSEITKLEDANERFIILHEEGIFYRAYERSAFLFYTQVCKMKLFKKSFKILKGREVVYLGFPIAAAEKYLSNLTVVERQDKMKKLQSPFGFDEVEYMSWHDGVHCAEEPISVSIEKQLKDMVSSYNVSMSTPVDAFNFVLKLKQIVNS